MEEESLTSEAGYNTVYKILGGSAGYQGADKSPRYDHVPAIQESDIKRESITRYFVQRFNESNVDDIFEVNQQEYEQLKNSSIWRSLSLPWRIAGNTDTRTLANNVKILGAEEANRNAVTYAETVLPNISHKLQNPLQYFQGFIR